MTRIDLIRPDQRDAAADTLAEAFQDDPLLQLLAPDVRRRPGVGRWFFGVTVDYGMRWGLVWVNDDATAVSLWLPPDSTWTARRSLRVGTAGFPLRVGPRAMIRVMQAAPLLERLHRAVQGPHWYLMAIGTRPARRGEGLGGLLIAAGTAQAEVARLPCYLETANPRNVGYFGRNGFEVTGTGYVHGHPVFGMAHEPQ